MKIKRTQTNLNLVDLKTAFKNLDKSLDDCKAISAAKAVLKNCDIIAIEDLLDLLGAVNFSQPGDAEVFKDKGFYQRFLIRLKRKLN